MHNDEYRHRNPRTTGPRNGPAVRRRKRHRSYTTCTPDPVADGSSGAAAREIAAPLQDRKSTRLNSSHVSISYAVFCLKKKQSLPISLGLMQSTPSCISSAFFSPIHTPPPTTPPSPYTTLFRSSEPTYDWSPQRTGCEASKAPPQLHHVYA